MSGVYWDKEKLGPELDQQVIELFVRVFGAWVDDANAPMHEIRARFELVGTMIGRTLAVVNHEGPVGVDIALKIRRYEEHYRARCARSVGSLWGPGGKLREHFSPVQTTQV
ncbi:MULTISPECIES: hypothetical protein [Pseudomonas]|uniref:hypothetical protein n=1 Tax=Pseudomonas TaxID=286 RepID=UPI0018A93B26|nr:MULTISPECIES: hypothetical protein [Pseudomonas]MBF8774456.1 hypothetical protein [Pseudomonas fulva]MBR7520347.1 hypothetical protein [Pseudomonas juntendi]HEE9762305.1 hypothetical protein [Pseudomonas putida]